MYFFEMPIINVHLLAGRSPKTKAQLIQALTDAAVATLGVAPEAVRVLLLEVAPEHWGVGGVSKATERMEAEKKS